MGFFLQSSSFADVADWEKIYDLPPHSSTITPRDTPRNVDVRGKLAAFENVSQQANPAAHQRFMVGDARRPSSYMRSGSADDGLQGSDVVTTERNDQVVSYSVFLFRKKDRNVNSRNSG